MEGISDKDLRVIHAQLERSVDNVLGVEKRCFCGFPQVILSYPIRDAKPFPTIHYLTCPHLRKEVAKLEEKGWIKKFEELLSNNTELFGKLQNAHKQVISKRQALLKPEDSDWSSVLTSVGTGGIRDWKTIKCLHLHLADYLAGIDNPIGEMVYNLIVEKECADCFCKTFEL